MNKMRGVSTIQRPTRAIHAAAARCVVHSRTMRASACRPLRSANGRHTRPTQLSPRVSSLPAHVVRCPPRVVDTRKPAPRQLTRMSSVHRGLDVGVSPVGVREWSTRPVSAACTRACRPLAAANSRHARITLQRDSRVSSVQGDVCRPSAGSNGRHARTAPAELGVSSVREDADLGVSTIGVREWSTRADQKLPKLGRVDRSRSTHQPNTPTCRPSAEQQQSRLAATIRRPATILGATAKA